MCGRFVITPGRREQSRPRPRGDRRQHLRARWITDDDGRRGVRDDEVEFRGRMRNGERHRDAAGTPDAEEYRDVIEGRRHQKRHAGFVETSVAGKQRGGDARGRHVQIAVRVRAAASTIRLSAEFDDGRAIGVQDDPIEGREAGGHGL